MLKSAGEVKLNLGEGHCIGCAARARLQELQRILFQMQFAMPKPLAAEYNLLRNFLIGASIEHLRGDYPQLDGRETLLVTIGPGGAPDRFRLRAHRPGEPHPCIDVECPSIGEPDRPTD